MNKKNNFNLINDIRNRIVSQNNIEPQKNEVIKDYKDDIQSTPKFSIGGNVFADKGFYINLERSVERKENVDNLINEFNIEGLLRFEALTDDMIQFACTKSHLQVFRTCLENDIESVFVAEDDFNIENLLYQPNSEPIYFKDKIKLIKEDLENLEWDVFLFGCNPKTHLIPLTNNVAIINKSTGAWAYIIKKRAFEFLLQNLNYKRDYIAIDDYLPILNDNGFTTLTSIPLTINHAVGFISTLQPRGPVNYTDWIKGNYHKFLFDNYPSNDYIGNKIEKDLTICISGIFSDNYIEKLDETLRSLPSEIIKCKIIIRFNTFEGDYNSNYFFELGAFFRDRRSDLNVSITYTLENPIFNLKYFLRHVKTNYFIMLDFDDLSLSEIDVYFNYFIEVLDENNFINIIQLDNTQEQSLISDVNGDFIYDEFDDRISKVSLITTPYLKDVTTIFRKSFVDNMYDEVLNLNNNKENFNNIFEAFYFFYKNQISQNIWDYIKDNFGIYKYNNINEI
jgi:hypothetical protein